MARRIIGSLSLAIGLLPAEKPSLETGPNRKSATPVSANGSRLSFRSAIDTASRLGPDPDLLNVIEKATGDCSAALGPQNAVLCGGPDKQHSFRRAAVAVSAGHRRRAGRRGRGGPSARARGL